MISVITPTYNTKPDILARTWASLKAQTHTDWEWVVYDDSTNIGVWRQLWGICADERFVVVPIRGMSNCGLIGKVKRRAFMAAEGNILVELDHDDELTPDALGLIQGAFDGGAGFVYSDWCEILPDGQSGRYPDGWAFGYGSHYWDEDHRVWAMRAPEINATTLSHIVSAPNHVRAWSADLYRGLGGHDPTMPVADDYELVVRTALETVPVHIPKMIYRQHIGPSTAQRVRNGQIQALVEEVSERYQDRIEAKYGHAGDDK